MTMSDPSMKKLKYIKTKIMKSSTGCMLGILTQDLKIPGKLFLKSESRTSVTFKLQFLILAIYQGFGFQKCFYRNFQFYRRDPNACSWKAQLEITRSWKLLSQKVRNEIGKNEVGKFEAKLKKSLLLYCIQNFPISIGSTNLVPSNLNGKFLTSDFLT